MTPDSSQPNRDTPSPALAAKGSRAEIKAASDNGATRLSVQGVFTVHTLSSVEDELGRMPRQGTGKVIFDLGNLERMDTAGALLLNRIMDTLRDDGRDCSVENADEQQQALLEKAVLPKDEKAKEKNRADKPAGPIAFVNGIGKAVCEQLRAVSELVGFLGGFLITLVKLVIRPGDMRWTSLVFHMEQVGIRAVPIVALLTFLIGLVVAYMGAQQLAMFGADIFAVNLLEVMVMREMAVLITAIVVAGRSSSSFTAQIGAMVANEEVDAMRSMGLDPATLLVVPRVLALMLCLPMLVFLADMMALLGGALAIWFTLDINFHAFLTQFYDVAKLDNFLVGMSKTPFFAVSIGLVGCFQGFRATGSAESVGFLTTVSVVQSIFIVILLDALFAMFFTSIGI